MSKPSEPFRFVIIYSRRSKEDQEVRVRVISTVGPIPFAMTYCVRHRGVAQLDNLTIYMYVWSKF